MCKNPHNATPQLVKESALPPLPVHIRKSGKSKVWFLDSLSGKYVHKDNLKEKYKLK